MLVPGETFSASYPAIPEAVPTARNTLTRFASSAGASPERLDAIRLAASEAITNAVLHAYDVSECGEVHVSASYVEGELWVLVSDAGHGMRRRDDSPGLGLGLALVAQLADEFQIMSRGSGTELRMRFDLAPVSTESEEWSRRSRDQRRSRDRCITPDQHSSSDQHRSRDQRNQLVA
jgi:anti-sigma regulatory factor (Ser/Thr protein kinase)